MVNKLTHDKVKEISKTLGFELLDKIYRGNKSKLTFRDYQGYFHHINFSQLKTQRKFDIVGKSNPYTIQNIKLWCRINNKAFNLKSNEYLDPHEHLKWKCSKEHCNEEFFASWAKISQDRGCPYCQGKKVGKLNCLATKHPEIAKEWHYEKNETLTPNEVACKSNKVVWWKCPDCKSEYDIPISARTNGMNCPYCAGKRVNETNCLETTHPNIAKEWHPTMNGNLTSSDVTHGSHTLVWWQCNKCNTPYDEIVGKRTNGRNCPYCAGRRVNHTNSLSSLYPEISKEWNRGKNEENPEEFTSKSGKRAWWKCSVCDYEWESIIANRTNLGRGCPECNESKGEKRIKQYLDDNKITYIPQKEFNELLGLGGRRLSFDFFLPENNILIEYQGEFHDGSSGTYSQINLKSQQEHDKRKKNYSKNNNIKLLEIWYWDFDNIEEILTKELDYRGVVF